MFTSEVGTLNLWLALDTNIRRVPHCRLQQPMQMWGWSCKSQSPVVSNQARDGKATQRASASVSAGKCGSAAEWGSGLTDKGHREHQGAHWTLQLVLSWWNQPPVPGSWAQWEGWSNGDSLSVKNCWVKGVWRSWMYTNPWELMGCTQGELADISERPLSATIEGHHYWERLLRTEIKQMWHIFKEDKKENLRVTDQSASPWSQGRPWNKCPGTHFQACLGQKVTGSAQCWLWRGK